VTIQLYDLAAADEARRFSPYCWRTRMALKHKQLDFETIPWRFTDKEAIAFTNQIFVPVLVDGKTVVNDSWRIAEYLDQTYPDQPKLFDSAMAKAEAHFIGHWADSMVHGSVSRMIILDIFNQVDPKDREYFRTSREKRFGKSLEAVQAERESAKDDLGKALVPMRRSIKEQAFLGGEKPGYADYSVFGAFQWARIISSYEILKPDDEIKEWRNRMLALFGGYAASYLPPGA